ncbi:translation elongation factor Ts [Mycoplasmopsis pulmonis]|uniref:translation elongation factor Ts n=1 Tax=Mycoplasmopsis pulmonis TaxID=2107 RepID=UPI00100502A2|nr:translation elongation factor Ts [Mycoplasmopsis pulmonis]MDZ7293664.1 translation elongation factor Ts [Mycoplasmopsis pulmonis]VEU68297.1 Elongation factor Ts [Mycoplasmopsis pulmonis]
MDASQKAGLIKKLREITNSGFLDCKKALEETNYDLDKAIEWLQENGKAKAAKKSGRIAAEGLVRASVKGKSAVIFELNSETDFVARNKEFLDLMDNISEALVENSFQSMESAENIFMENDLTILEATTKATATIGEKISFRRAKKFDLLEDQTIGAYTHANGRIASLFLVRGKNEEVAKNVAMHIAAMNPEYMSANEVPQEKIEKLKAEFLKSPALAGKPEKIQQSILNGMLNKALAEFVLLNQPFVMESSLSVEQYLKNNKSEALEMIRYEVGEGIEKKAVDFASEVAAQMKK